MELIIPLLVPFVLIAFFLFDILLKRFHRDHSEEWENAGRPTGMFPSTIPKADRSFGGSFTGNGLLFIWLFHTPKWMHQQKDNTLVLVWLFRICVLIWNVGVIGGALLIGCR